PCPGCPPDAWLQGSEVIQSKGVNQDEKTVVERNRGICRYGLVAHGCVSPISRSPSRRLSRRPPPRKYSQFLHPARLSRVGVCRDVSGSGRRLRSRLAVAVESLLCRVNWRQSGAQQQSIRLELGQCEVRESS